MWQQIINRELLFHEMQMILHLRTFHYLKTESIFEFRFDYRSGMTNSRALLRMISFAEAGINVARNERQKPDISVKNMI